MNVIFIGSNPAKIRATESGLPTEYAGTRLHRQKQFDLQTPPLSECLELDDQPS